MSINRRRFIALSGRAGIGLATASTGLLFGAVDTLTTDEISADRDISEVAAFASGYADRLEVRRKADSTVHIRARTSVQRLVQVLQNSSLPFEAVHCDGNQFTFLHGQTRFIVDNVV